MLLSESFNEPVMPLLPVLAFLSQGLFKPPDLSEILVFFKLDSVPLKVSLLNALFALCGKILNRLFSLLILSHLLLLVLQQRDQVIVLLSPRVKLICDRSDLVFELI